MKKVALSRGLPVTERAADVVGSGAELGVVVAFGQLIRPAVLEAVPMVNVHFSLLPRWRGAAPVEWAILAGDAETGVCLMELEEGLDTGPVYVRRAVAIGKEESAEELSERLGALGTAMLLDTLASGLPTPEPQVGESTYARKRTVAECELDFSRSAIECARLVRAGRAWTTFRDRRLLVHRARPRAGSGGAPGTLNGALVSTGDGLLELVEVQEQGRGALAFATWAQGARPAAGELLIRTGPLDNDGER